MIRLAKIVLCVCVALAIAPAAALAAPPLAGPQVLVSDGFEGALAPGLTIESIYDIRQPITPAWWGPTTSIAHTGSRSLWGAGMTPAGTSAPWATPPAGSRGRLIMALPQLQSYYSAKLSLWYWLSALGVDDYDNNAFQVYWYRSGLNDGYGEPIKALTPAAVASSSFVQRQFDLGALPKPLAGVGGTAVVHWFDNDDGVTKAPAIDDLAVTGYMFGPVRNLKATPGSAEMVLSWDTPYRTQWQTTVDPRAIAYRVWRSPAGQDLWTELTPTRISGNTFTDGTPGNAVLYDYAVQAWEPGAGEGRGEVKAYATASATGGAAITPATLTMSALPATGYTWQPIVVTGALGPQHTAGTNQVSIEAQKLVGASWVSSGSWAVSVLDAGTGSSYSKALSIPSTGTWRIRAVHLDADHAVATGWKQFTVSDFVLLSTPSKPSRAYKNKAFTSTGTLKPRHSAGTSPVAIQAYLYSSKTRKWSLKKTFYAKASSYSTYSKYTASIKLPYTGTWKLRGFHPGHTGQAATYTSYTGTFLVK